MKNTECSMLGTMLHLDIQKGEEAMKTSNFQKYIEGTTVCMRRLAIANKWCGQLTSNDIYFADIWFSSVKTAEEAMAVGLDHCGPVKTIHKSFCLAKLEKLMKDWPGRSHLVMKSNPRVPGGIPLLEIGYKYNYRKVIGFNDIERYGSNEPGDPYLSCFPDIYSNVSVRPVVFPHLLGRYFNTCNEIENHSRIRHSDISL